MKLRQGFVSNSSSSSFIVAMRKGYTWEHAIKDAGPFEAFARALADYVGPMQSAQNMPLAQAKYYAWEGATPEDILESAKEEFPHTKDQCEDIVDVPGDWVFAIGDASYNDIGCAIEAWLGFGGEVDSENLKVRKVPQ